MLKNLVFRLLRYHPALFGLTIDVVASITAASQEGDEDMEVRNLAKMSTRQMTKRKYLVSFEDHPIHKTDSDEFADFFLQVHIRACMSLYSFSTHEPVC